MKQWLRRPGPLLVVLGAIFILGYPFAFLMGYPLARQSLKDRSRWTQRTIVPLPPADLIDPTVLRFGTSASGILVRGEAPFQGEYQVDGDLVRLPPGTQLISLADVVGAVDGVNQVFRVAEPGRERPLYLDGRLLDSGFEKPPEKPDGRRTEFTFTSTQGRFILRGRLLEPGVDYALDGAILRLTEPAPLWLSLQVEPAWARPLRITGHYAWADEQTIVFNQPPPAGSSVQLAREVVRWAERLLGETDGINRTFRLQHGAVVASDSERGLAVDSRQLSAQGLRPREPLDGVRTAFTFQEASGLITLDGRLLQEGRDYRRQGEVVALRTPPDRRSTLRQYADYLLADPAAGTVLLSQPPSPGSVVWAARYTVYDQPKCGRTVYQCFLSLPQHPVPLPHWVVARIPSFVTRFDLQSDRNLLRQVLYTSRGALVALAMGGGVGLVLAMLFVLIRPLERSLLPWVVASQTVPIIALVPMLVLILANFGIIIQASVLPTALIGAYLSFFPITVGAVKGLRSVHPLALDLMRSYAATQHQVFTMVRIPASLPFVFTSFKIGAAVSLVGAMISETETSNAKGLGFSILSQVQTGNVADLWILLLISSLMGIALVSAVGWLQRVLAPWERRV